MPSATPRASSPRPLREQPGAPQPSSRKPAHAPHAEHASAEATLRLAEPVLIRLQPGHRPAMTYALPLPRFPRISLSGPPVEQTEYRAAGRIHLPAAGLASGPQPLLVHGASEGSGIPSGKPHSQVKVQPPNPSASIWPTVTRTHVSHFRALWGKLCGERNPAVPFVPSVAFLTLGILRCHLPDQDCAPLPNIGVAHGGRTLMIPQDPVRTNARNLHADPQEDRRDHATPPARRWNRPP